jgi:hypothetical protein
MYIRHNTHCFDRLSKLQQHTCRSRASRTGGPFTMVWRYNRETSTVHYIIYNIKRTVWNLVSSCTTYPNRGSVSGTNKKPRVCTVKNTNLNPEQWTRTTRSPSPVRGPTRPSTPPSSHWCEESYPKVESPLGHFSFSFLGCHPNTVHLHTRVSRHMNYRVYTWNTRQSTSKITSSGFSTCLCNCIFTLSESIVTGLVVLETWMSVH